jgi:integrase
MPIKKTRSRPTGVPGIVQDGPGRFIVRARWTDPRTGRRRKREAVAATLAEAVTLRERFLAGEEQKERPTRQRFADYAEQWIEAHAAEVAPSTRTWWGGALAHAIVGLGRNYVDSLRPVDIREWRNKAMKGVAPATVNGWHRVLKQVLDGAVEDGLLEGNPARSIKALKEGRTKGPRGNSLGAEEFRQFITTTKKLSGGAISEDVARFIQTLAWTGLRKGEALALKWGDYRDGELFVERSVWNRKEKSTKTDDPRRIAVVEPLAEVLAEQRQWLLRTQHPGLASDLIFPASPRHSKAGTVRRGEGAEGSWFRSGSLVDKPLRLIVAEAGIPRISAHSLRRTWENLLRRAGVDQLVRRSLAGWRSEEAQAIYANVDRSEREAAGAAVVRLVMGERT